MDAKKSNLEDVMKGLEVGAEPSSSLCINMQKPPRRCVCSLTEEINVLKWFAEKRTKKGEKVSAGRLEESPRCIYMSGN